jgi:LuxR family transcriptional regulator, maltose regulon positive regulatory protein
VVATAPSKRVLATRTIHGSQEVRRALLVERLADSDRSLVVIAAPAGYGKTTLVRQWAAEDNRPFAWLRVDDGHNESSALLLSLIRALEDVESFDPELTATLPGSSDGASLASAVHIGAALAARSSPCVVVLDDVHHLTHQPALGVIAAVLAHLPAGSQAVLAGRSDRALSAGDGVGTVDAFRLGAADLAMGASEGELLLSSAGVELETGDLELLMERAEGWAAGLSLAVAALSDEGGVEALSGADRGLAEYIARDVLTGVDARTFELLVRTSILDELNSSLCDAVVEQQGSGVLLEELYRSNLLLVQLDGRGERYRYHGLFREWLQRELHRRDADLELLLHRRASAWYERHGRHDPAIRHALAGGDIERAGDLVWESTGLCIVRGRTATVVRWLDAFTDDEIAAHPMLALAAASVDLANGRADEASHWMWLAAHADGEQARSATSELESHLEVFKAVCADGDIAQEHADRAFLLENARSPWHAVACFYAGLTRHVSGDVDGARARFEDAALSSAVLWPAVHANCLAELALLAADRGEWAEAVSMAGRARTYGDERGLAEYPPMAIVPAVHALALAHRGEALDARLALEGSRRLVRALGRVAPHLRAQARVVLARASLSMGDTATTRELLRELRPLLAKLPAAAGLRERVAELESSLEAFAEAIVGPLTLTAAELRVLGFLPMHLSMSKIAEQLFVSRNTVKSQAIAIYRKLGVSSRGSAVARARELGLLES